MNSEQFFSHFKLKDSPVKYVGVYEVYKKITDEEIIKMREENAIFPEKMPQEDKEFLLKNQLITVVSSRKEFIEYIKRYYAFTHQEHFYSWCKLHGYEMDEFGFSSEDDSNKDIDYFAPINKYFNLSVENDAEFVLSIGVVKTYYTPEDICYLARKSYKCLPIGCSTQKRDEYDSYYENLMMDKLSNMDDKELNEVLGYVDEEL